MNADERNRFVRLPLYAHKFLAGVPLKSLYRLDLPGGPCGMTIQDIKEAAGFDTENLETGVIATSLFWLRGLIGRIFGWDDADELAESISYISRLGAAERGRSRIEPGKKEGISRVLYCFENEFAAEIVNRTVHCFWVMAKERTSHGYALYMAVYVRKLNWFTPVYMALVTPMLKWIIYPALNESVLKNWQKSRRPQESVIATALN